MEQQQPTDENISSSSNRNGFSLDAALNIMLKEACSKGSNFVFSPFSFHSMLCLIAAGAKGSVLEQLLQVLGYRSLEEVSSSMASRTLLPMLSTVNNERDDVIPSGPIISFVNSAWVDRRFKLKPSFEELAKQVYRATVKQVDFVCKAREVEDEINLWVAKETKGLIRSLLPQGSLEDDTALVLANALYFKGQWDRKFDPARTQVRSFHLLNSPETVAVPFMTTKPNQKHLYKSFDGYKVLKIPYQNPEPENEDNSMQFSMHFFLPDEPDSLPTLVQKIRTNPGMLNNYSDQLKLENLPQLWIPRFKFSFEVEAKEALEELGMGFKAGELTEMVDCGAAGDKLSLSKMFHKAFVEVNEEGTEAAASTAPRFIRKCGRRNPPSFVADHAFMFTIVEEKSGIVLFLGAVINPLTVSAEG
ncbi:unnamed protein product [Linum tenue]|uniref:Serpin domain-containing protein n=1 Tax=Linum tenue TaxID=586396 RepID=A0AAV0N7U6_9ROSI|nr:unnamed protein product [Linum tenue]